ncbi:MAG: hypothetical protein JSV92_03380 [archaeon]|nr:MAG: hypothetical protein JSV92_03380 [archaeon]
MAEEMVSLNKFLEEMISVINQRLERQEKTIFTIEKRLKIMERVLRETNTGKVKSSILNELKK